MNAWVKESSVLRMISGNPYGSGFIFILFSILGIVCYFISAVVLLYIFTEGPGPGSVFAAFFLFAFGSILFFSLFEYRRGKKIVKTVEIDKEKGVLRLTETGRQDVTWDLGDVIGYYLTLTKTGGSSSGSSGTYNDHNTFLLKNDGSLFWLDTVNNAKLLRENLEMFRDYLLLPVLDKSGAGLGTSEGNTPANSLFKTEYSPSRWIRSGITNEGTSVELFQPFSFKNILTIFLVYSMFFGAIGYVIYQFILEGTPGVVAYFFLIPFATIFIGILLVSIVFLIFKKITLVATSSGLAVRYASSIPLIGRFLGRTRRFSKEEIRHIRASHLETDQDLLIVALCKKRVKSSLSDFLWNVRALTLADKLLPGDDEILGIWQAMSWISTGPGYGDLVYAEKLLEERLGLNEEKIEFKDITL